jgi:hypothetical protein
MVIFRAIAANRKVESILNEMRSISQEILLNSAPGTRKNQAAKSSQKGLNLAPFVADPQFTVLNCYL